MKQMNPKRLYGTVALLVLLLGIEVAIVNLSIEMDPENGKAAFFSVFFIANFLMIGIIVNTWNAREVIKSICSDWYKWVHTE